MHGVSEISRYQWSLKQAFHCRTSQLACGWQSLFHKEGSWLWLWFWHCCYFRSLQRNLQIWTMQEPKAAHEPERVPWSREQGKLRKSTKSPCFSDSFCRIETFFFFACLISQKWDFGQERIWRWGYRGSGGIYEEFGQGAIIKVQINYSGGESNLRPQMHE